jgi:cystathionine beta-lyase/cystathionine gamma-synthase
MRLETQLIHAGEQKPRIGGAVVMPIFQSSTFVTEATTGYHDVRYVRLSNTPNHRVLADKLAALEGAEDALVTASGMAAISATLLAFLGAGDHVLVQDNVYGGTHDLLTRDLSRLGISHDFVDLHDPGTWAARLRPTTRLLYVEAITNPLCRVGDLAAAARFAREHGLVSVIDATFATPVLFRPIAHGFAVVVHSATKYLNGHSDIGAGAVIGRRDLVERVKHKLDHLGGALDPHACFLLHRGLKTLALRVRAQCQSALTIARFLDRHAAVACVHYPGLPHHGGHERARALFDGHFGAMLSFELAGGPNAAERFLERLRIPIVAPSLGGPETLVTRPAATSHAGLDAEERRRAGITDGLVRMSVGLEATEDLVEDLQSALVL